MWNRRDKDMLDMWVDLLNTIELESRYARPDFLRNDVQVNEENGTLTITAELAGVGKDEVNVEVSSSTVSIDASTDKKNFNWNRSFDYELDPESTKATMVNGILDLSIEKKEKTTAKKIEIE